MYTGAVLTALTALVIILVAPRVGVLHVVGRPPVLESHTRQVIRAAFGGAVESAAWLWMAWKIKSGRAWARVTSTAFFALCCVGTPLELHNGEAIVVRPFQVAIWLVALAATIHLWLPESGSFYRQYGIDSGDAAHSGSVRGALLALVHQREHPGGYGLERVRREDLARIALPVRRRVALGVEQQQDAATATYDDARRFR
jgi:hypothetical protein